jgi:hypothetical protein
MNTPNTAYAVCLLLNMMVEDLWPQLDIYVGDVADDEAAYEKHDLAHQTYGALMRELKPLGLATATTLWSAYGPAQRKLPTFLFSEYEVH